jgi:Putative beta-barrel porin-2, OmpL-like. bbp2
MLTRMIGIIVPAMVGLVSSAAAQAADSSAADSSAPDSSAPRRRLAVSGFAEASYTYSTRGAGDVIVGRLYDRFHDEFVINALAVTLEIPYSAATLSAGFHSELFFGQNAAVIKSGGFNLGDQGDIPHLYVTLNAPTHDGNGVQFKLGRIPTLLGLEVIEDVANPNWSEGNQFIYVENFTGTGLSIERKFSDHVDAQFRIINGWDLVKDNNTRKSLMGRVGWYPREGTAVAAVGYWGPEQPDNPDANRYGAELLAGTKFGPAPPSGFRETTARSRQTRCFPTPRAMPSGGRPGSGSFATSRRPSRWPSGATTLTIATGPGPAAFLDSPRIPVRSSGAAPRP